MVTGNFELHLNAIQKISEIEVGQFAPEKHILSINLRIDGLSFLIQKSDFSIIHQEAFEWNGVRSWDSSKLKISQLLENHELLSLVYPKVNVYLQSKSSLLIPKDLFDESKIKLLYKTYFGLEQDKELYTMLNNNSVLVYGVNHDISSIFNTKWNTSWNHMSSFFINEKIKRASREQEVHLNFHHNVFEVLALNKRKLESHNYFDYSSSEEFIFKLLSFCKQINFEAEYIQLFLQGDITESSVLHKLIEQYLPNVYFAEGYKQDQNTSLQELIQVVTHANS